MLLHFLFHVEEKENVQLESKGLVQLPHLLMGLLHLGSVPSGVISGCDRRADF